MPNEITTAVQFLAANQTLILSYSLIFLGCMVLILWFRIYRLNDAIRREILVYAEGPGTKTSRTDSPSTELKRRLESLAAEVQKDLEEERGRINALQRMAVELKDKQTAAGRMAEKSLQTGFVQMNQRLDALEKRLERITHGGLPGTPRLTENDGKNVLA